MAMNPKPEPDDESVDVSKSERKRQMHYLQSLGEQLTTLSASQLASLSLPDALDKAIAATASIRKHEAKRRHLQFIGKLMRKADPTLIESVENLLANLQRASQQHNDAFHALENWRDRLLGGDPGELEQFLADFPQADRQRLRQLVRQHQQEVDRQKTPTAARKLFQYLRELVENCEQQ